MFKTTSLNLYHSKIIHKASKTYKYNSAMVHSRDRETYNIAHVEYAESKNVKYTGYPI